MTQTKSYLKVFSSLESGCDSVVTLNLFSAPRPTVFQVNADFCPEDGYINFGADNTLYADKISIYVNDTVYTFSARAENIDLSIASNNFRSGKYTAVAISENPWCEAMTDTVEFTLNLPSSVIESKWDNVLAILNEKYNGGYRFRSYQWLQDGQPIKGANGSWYRTEQALDTDSEYSVEVELEDGTKLLICPFTYQTAKAETTQKTRKILYNGNLYIINNDAIYDIYGRKIN